MQMKRLLWFIYIISIILLLTACDTDKSNNDSYDSDYNNKSVSPRFISSNSIKIEDKQIEIVTLKVYSSTGVKYAITSGDDANMFKVDSNTGKLKFKVALDSQNPKDIDKNNIYDVVLSAVDENGKIGLQSISVEIVPSSYSSNLKLLHFISNNVIEVPSKTLKIMTVKVNKENILYGLYDGLDKEKFYINRDTGLLSFRTIADYTTPTDSNRDNIYEVTVMATTQNNEQMIQKIEITVTNQVINPPDFKSKSENSIPENQIFAHTVYAMGNGNLDYTIVGNDDDSLFTIDSINGELKFIAKPNYLNPLDKNLDNKYELTIMATDESGLKSMQKITITVTSVVDDISFISPSSSTILEESQLSFSVEAIGASEIIYSIDDLEDGKLFTISATTGELNFIELPDFELPIDSDKDNHYKITIRASTTSGKSIKIDITIVVMDKEESKIKFISQSKIITTENKKRLFKIKATGSENISFSIANSEDSSLFVINNDTDELMFRERPDFEKPQDLDKDNRYTLILVAYDKQNEIIRQAVTIVVRDIVEISVPLLIVRVQYSNYTFNHNEAIWHKKLFGSEHGELNDYYNEVSYGRFRFKEARENYGEYDGIITVTLDKKLNDNLTKGEFNDNAIQALQLANPYIDFVKFDKNNDGSIDRKELSILFISAGGECSTNASPGVWGHSTSIRYSLTLDSVRLMSSNHNGSFAVVGERYFNIETGVDTQLGTIAHELGHATFDLIDLYDIDYSSEGIGNFGLMGTGLFGHIDGEIIGETPVHMTGWSKIKCGFVSPIIINSSISNLSVADTVSIDYNLYKISTGRKGEYFLIENRNNRGYDRGLYILNGFESYTGGLSILHIDDSKYSNEEDNHRVVDVEEANNPQLDKSTEGNNRGDQSNLFYAANSDSFTPYTTPNSNRYDGQSSQVNITNISERSSIMYLDIEKQ